MGNAPLTVPANASYPEQLGLSRYDATAVTAFVKGDRDEIAALIEDTRLVAQGLASEGGDAARVRMAAREAAAARSQARVLQALLGERLAARDTVGVELISKALDGTTRRLALMLKHLAMESALRRRPTVVVGHADVVSVGKEPR